MLTCALHYIWYICTLQLRIFSCCIQCYCTHVAKCVVVRLYMHYIWCVHVHHDWLILSKMHTYSTYLQQIMYLYLCSNELLKEGWLYARDDFDHQGLHQVYKVWYVWSPSGRNILPQPFSTSLLSGVLKPGLLPQHGPLPQHYVVDDWQQLGLTASWLMSCIGGSLTLYCAVAHRRRRRRTAL